MLPRAATALLPHCSAVLVVTLAPPALDGSATPQLAAAPAGVSVVSTDVAGQTVTAPETTAVGSVVVRDAQLDRYLRAHREYATALPGSLPGGSGRSITAVSFDR